MKINNQSSLKYIKSAFNEMFPYLKLEFYRHTHDAKKSSPQEDQLAPDARIEDLVAKDINVDIEVLPSMTVSEFESLFFKNTGVGVQVFRNSAGIWLQTSKTDSWTLEKQNGKGERSEEDYDIDPVRIQDFDIED